jgi:hypothetical protein
MLLLALPPAIQRPSGGGPLRYDQLRRPTLQLTLNKLQLRSSNQQLHQGGRMLHVVPGMAPLNDRPQLYRKASLGQSRVRPSSLLQLAIHHNSKLKHNRDLPLYPHKDCLNPVPTSLRERRAKFLSLLRTQDKPHSHKINCADPPFLTRSNGGRRYRPIGRVSPVTGFASWNKTTMS